MSFSNFFIESDSAEELDFEHSETDSTALSSSSDNETDSNQSQNDIFDEWTKINIETDVPAASTCFGFTAR
ncbi:hypothetical protein HHI36_012043, partial [Cryptolaemus montrouzieri]